MLRFHSPPTAFQLAFALQRLAELVSEGIPLEAALQRVSGQCAPHGLKHLLQKLSADLARGMSPETALQNTKWDGIFQSVFAAGFRSQQMPSALALLATHYERMAAMGVRLRIILFYPLLLIAVCIASGGFLSHALLRTHREMELLQTLALRDHAAKGWPADWGWMLLAWLPLLLVSLGSILLLRSFRPSQPGTSRWFRIPGVQESGLSRTSSLFHLLLSGGMPLPEAIEQVQRHETVPTIKRELQAWHSHLKAGHTCPPPDDGSQPTVIHLMTWLAQGSRTGSAEGFARAADYYHSVATRKLDGWIHTLLPACILAVGICVMFQVLALFFLFTGSTTFLTWN